MAGRGPARCLSLSPIPAEPHPACDPPAVPVLLDGDALDVDSGGGLVLVVERLLRLDEAAGLLGHDAGVGVAGLVQVDVREPPLPRARLQVLDEGARGERRAGSARPVVARPQRPLRPYDIPPPRRREVLPQRLVGGRVGDLAGGELPALPTVLDDERAFSKLQVSPLQSDDLAAPQTRQEVEEQQCESLFPTTEPDPADALTTLSGEFISSSESALVDSDW
jgi:hypothetical protein